MYNPDPRGRQYSTQTQNLSAALTAARQATVRRVDETSYFQYANLSLTKDEISTIESIKQRAKARAGISHISSDRTKL